MTDHFLYTPYFLDAADDDVAALAGDGWRAVTAELPPGEQLARMGAIYDALGDAVAETLATGQRPVAVVGDCCATIGVLVGLRRAGLEPAVLWFDAHGDFNTPETSPSGFLGGMPLAMVAGLGPQTLLDATGLTPWPAEKIVLCDGRDLDPGERENIARAGIGHLRDIETLIGRQGQPAGPLYVHFDCDVIDPADAPAMNYPAPGGPSAEMVRDVFRALAASGRVVAVSMTLWDSALDPDGRTQAVAQAALNALLAH